MHLGTIRSVWQRDVQPISGMTVNTGMQPLGRSTRHLIFKMWHANTTALLAQGKSQVMYLLAWQVEQGELPHASCVPAWAPRQSYSPPQH